MAFVEGHHVLNTSVLFFYACLSFIVFLVLYNAQPVPYMDEIFHIPQAQKYCKGIFNQWDSKITTPPGLYIVSVGVLGPVSQALGQFLCQTWHLRLVNLAFTTGNMYLLNSITRKLHPSGSRAKATLSALNLSLFPVLYFFTFLYYTDVGSTFFVLLAYLNHLYGQSAMAAAFGALSLFFRQTNIIWVFFMACEKLSEVLISQVRFEKKKSGAYSKGSFLYLLQLLRSLITMPLHQRKLFLYILTESLYNCASYLCVGIAFLVFLFWNGGVVVGDRSAHQMAPHLPQLCYFLGLLLAFANPFLLTWPKIVRCFNYCRTKPVQAIGWMLAMALSLRYLTYEHPYLISDNRHLTFYVWKRFLGKDLLRYCFIPVYYYSAWALLNVFQSKNALWKFFFGVSVMLAVVPQPLLEFRYFILPYIFFRLHIPVGSTIQLLTELVLYVFVNSATIYLFVQHPFTWEGHSETQRFMW